MIEGNEETATIMSSSSSSSLKSISKISVVNISKIITNTNWIINYNENIETATMFKKWLNSLKTIASSAGVTVKGASTTLPQRIFNIPIIFTLFLLLAFSNGLITVNGLKCYMCGQYNEGVGSITPCLNYSEKHQYLYLKDCSKRSEKYCVKYVSELSTVRDCATECVEKEIWETQTYCCTEDGCNGSMYLRSSNLIIILPILCYFIRLMFNLQKLFR